MAQIFEKKLLFDGFVYVGSKFDSGKTYWDYRKVCTGECKARAITASFYNYARRY